MSSTSSINCFLIPLYEKETSRRRDVAGVDTYYHLFPSFSVVQEEWSNWIKTRSGFLVKQVPQRDGSKLVIMKPQRRSLKTPGSVWSLRQALMTHSPYKLNIFASEQEVGQSVSIRTFDDPARYHYLVIQLHEFDNGMRILPIVFHPIERTCWDISKHFQTRNCDDDLGILVGHEEIAEKGLAEVLRLHVLGLPEVVDYRPAVRLCECCLHPRNVLVGPPKRVWINTRWKNLQTHNLLKRNN